MLISAAFLLFVSLAVNGDGEVKLKEAGEVGGCPIGWLNSERQCYKLFKQKRQWADAEKQCVKIRGHLASVHTPSVNALLKTLVQKQAPKSISIWIGGQYTAEKAAWSWSDGSKFDYSNWGAKPAEGGKKKICASAAAKDELRWKDKSCNTPLSFVCYKTSGAVIIN